MDTQPVVLTEKIPIGISMCCMESPVRYNGKALNVLAPLGREKGDFIWCPVCPECAAGLGVPRDPIHLTNGDGSMVWTGEAGMKSRGGAVVTEAMKLGCLASLETLQRCNAVAYIYIDGST